MRIIGALSAAMFLTSGASQALDFPTSAGTFTTTAVATGLNEPWGLAFLPDGQFLVTERDGALTLYPAAGGEGQSLEGVPDVFAKGQGGLLDVMVPRDFAQTREIFLSYSEPSGFGMFGAAALGKARLSDDGTRLEGFTTIFRDPEPSVSGVHFGSRIVEATDGSIFMTSGERGEGELAQDPALANGKVFHLGRDGTPLTEVEDALAGVYSMGHRNPQGAALDADGQLWVVEHGAQGGDELNLIKAGANYGWPVISYGKDYDDSKIGIGTEGAGLEQPERYWDPSIAPSGLMIYSGEMFPEWQGDFFTGSLKFGFISRLDPQADWAEEVLQSDQTGRVRDIRQAPDGSIWYMSVTDGAVYRIAR